jgi:simple sugar transport system ATP-binding protein
MYLLEALNMSKTFSENMVKANSSIDFTLIEGETHSILGENGSGKSTLMHILTGLIPPDSGEIIYRGDKIIFRSPKDALDKKIGMVHQSPGIIPGFTIYENIIAGNSSVKGFKTGKSSCRRKIESIKKKYSINIDTDKIPDTPEQKQYTILLSLLFRGIEIIVFDEPTTSLSDNKSEEFFTILKKLKDNGKTVVFITHRIATALVISDRITVLSKGESRGSFRIKNIDQEKIFNLMIENFSKDTFSDRYEGNNRSTPEGEKSIIISADNIRFTDRNESKKLELSFKLHEKEIIGFAGIRENNLNLLEDILGGFINPDSGSIKFRGKEIKGYTTAELRNTGITYIPSDRFTRGTSITSSVENNMAITNIRDFTRGGMVSNTKLKEHFNRGRGLYNIKADYGQPLWQLSGGNIQKVILFRELDSSPEVLIFCEPAWNLDIKTRNMIYDIIRKMRDRGTSVIILSTDIEEIVGISDRVYVMYRGESAGILKGKDINSKNIGKLMLGMGDKGAENKKCE